MLSTLPSESLRLSTKLSVRCQLGRLFPYSLLVAFSLAAPSPKNKGSGESLYIQVRTLYKVVSAVRYYGQHSQKL